MDGDRGIGQTSAVEGEGAEKTKTDANIKYNINTPYRHADKVGSAEQWWLK